MKRILYAEDDVEDSDLLVETVKSMCPDIEVVVVENGLKAIDYLEKVKNDHDKLPCLIILDINMPYLDGKKTFKKIKAEPAFQDVELVIFTTTENPHDKDFFKKYNTELITKPSNLSYYKNVITEMLKNCQ